jgi:hypothetical protein
MLPMWKRLWEAWKRVAKRIGNFQARLLLMLFYAVLALPFGLAVRWAADSLRTKRPSKTWMEHPAETIDLPWAHRQW